MIQVCPSCSNVSIDELIEKFGEKNVEIDCLSECGMNPENSFGYVNGKWVFTETEEDFLEKTTELLSETISE
ncbi:MULTISPECIES: DUF1450 domain-containing protein [unclassified Fusibacter]|uniref:DUF1450 domain-containing protein n=1 Tax=unclassified Fusibacter TaxID=2624464 RepID=UPI001010B2B3|nr:MULTISPECIES: DUF1450 domain-containing protein [unclassified Fusibacter]MCK8060001.1 YuzB family protein [Fusibacter sp. A2]NPE22141.1 DUF1450 domain-containing protein [Fusibacter sp. A1]RXV60919.1 DUF1450 domain-containing protein [Fusibacter sp. A1]